MTFKPGQSGNPGGRPKNPARAAALPYVEEAIAQYVATMRDASLDAEIRNKACDRILDRAIGRPTQSNEVTGLDGEALVTRIVYGWADSPAPGASE